MTDFDFDSTRDQRWVTLYDDEALAIIPAWSGGTMDPLYAISSSGGANYAWVFEDAIANIDADLARVKKLGRNKYQLGKGTFTKVEIDELHHVRAALAWALEEETGRVLEEAQRYAKFNRRDYKFYVVVGGMIDSGWEYREDANDAKRDLPDPRAGKVFTKSGLRTQGINPDDNAFWTTAATAPYAQAPSIRYPDPPRGPRGPFVAPRSRARARRRPR
jgi:hypothetical protein